MTATTMPAVEAASSSSSSSPPLELEPPLALSSS
jgi:hypothetical protein